MTDRAMAFFELIRLQAELEVASEELADMAEADLKAYEAAELEAKQRVSAIDPISVRQWG